MRNCSLGFADRTTHKWHGSANQMASEVFTCKHCLWYRTQEADEHGKKNFKV